MFFIHSLVSTILSLPLASIVNEEKNSDKLQCCETILPVE